MFNRSRISASGVARIFVVSVCLVIVVLEVWSGLREHDVELTESTRATSNVAMALAQHADQTFNEVDIVLLGLLERLEKDGNSKSGLARTHDLMVSRVGGLPQLAGLFVYDDQGNWVVNSQPTLEKRFNNSDRDYFIYHRLHRVEKPFIGKPIKSKSTGQWILTISRRINKIDGSFGGVVLGTIDLSFFQRFYAQFDIGKNGAIMLGSLDGTVLHRRPLLPDSIGKNLENSPLFQEHVRRSGSGSVEIRSTQDSVVRINSFRYLADHPLFIIVAMSKDEVLAEWMFHVWVRVIGVAAVLIILYYGGTKMVAQVKRREVAELDAIKSKRKLESLYKTLEAQSQKDGLTAVFNRRYFDDSLSSQLALLNRSGGILSLIMVDVDHFKRFNDTYGHAAGDVCLQRVAAAIQAAVQREGDVVARYGGEEFAVILPECDKAGALIVARSLINSLHEEKIEHASSGTGFITVSVGVTSIAVEPGRAITPRKMIEAADEGLYLAKDQGRDQVIFREFSPQARNRILCFDEEAA